MRRIALVLLSLMSAALFAQQERVRAVPLLTISYPPPPIAGADHGDIAFNDDYVFFGTDGGLFRTPLAQLGNVQPQRVAFESTPVTGLAVHQGSLYAILDVQHPTGPGATNHSLLKSADDGISWTALDQELEECSRGTCEFLVASEIHVAGDRLFVNSGGNLLVSGDEGASWTILYGHTTTGKPMSQACYHPSFALVGQRLLLGGECPLDSAYLRTGTLRPDLLDWQDEPAPATTPPLANRNIQFIRRRGDSALVYAGIEGALLRSSDAGASYELLLFYSGDAPKYPYITEILFPSKRPSAIVIAGFDKAGGGPFLALSSDNGATWRDESRLLPGPGLSQWSVSALVEDPTGRILIGVEDDAGGVLYLSELRFSTGERRRPVGRAE